MSASSESEFRAPDSGHERRVVRRGAVATLGCLLAFVGFVAAAMALYPGGTFLDRAHPGPSFFGNFFCDLTQPISLSGVPNPVGSRLAQAGMLSFAGALWGLFWLSPRCCADDRRVRLWVARLGTPAVLAFVAVPLMPSERFGWMHAALALISGAFGLGAALLAVRLSFASERRWLGVLGTLTLVVCAFDAIIFIHHLGSTEPPPLLVPAAQKIAALLLCTWIAGVALSSLFGKAERGRLIRGGNSA
ncbi:MAG TPA: hypothetical protein VGM44_11230 [Polyangiaceae bacterium]|jgi:hypothetical protein